MLAAPSEWSMPSMSIPSMCSSPSPPASEWSSSFMLAAPSEWSIPSMSIPSISSESMPSMSIPSMLSASPPSPGELGSTQPSERVWLAIQALVSAANVSFIASASSTAPWPP